MGLQFIYLFIWILLTVFLLGFFNFLIQSRIEIETLNSNLLDYNFIFNWSYRVLGVNKNII